MPRCVMTTIRNPDYLVDGIPAEDRLLATEAIRHYGLENRMLQMQEELAEAMAAISHFRRGRENAREEVAEELADVSVVLEHLLVEFGPEVARWRAIKKERLRARPWMQGVAILR